jgi:hypothetical protein
MALACADIVSLYFLVATLPTCVDASYDFGNVFLGVDTNLLGGVWLYLECIFWLLFVIGLSGFVWATMARVLILDLSTISTISATPVTI